METYEEILERMKQTFAQQAGYELEKNSDVELPMQVIWKYECKYWQENFTVHLQT